MLTLFLNFKNFVRFRIKSKVAFSNSAFIEIIIESDHSNLLLINDFRYKKKKCYIIYIFTSRNSNDRLAIEYDEQLIKPAVDHLSRAMRIEVEPVDELGVVSYDSSGLRLS